MFNPLSSYNPDSQPLGHFKNYPVYLATVLVAVHVVSMLAGVVISPQSYGEALAFSPDTFSPLGQPWRWVTYAFVHEPRIWFLLEMYLLFSFARDLEANFGRKVLIRLYAALILLPPLLMDGAYSTALGRFRQHLPGILSLAVGAFSPRAASVLGMPSSVARLSASASRRRIRPAMASLVIGGSARAPSTAF